MKMLVFRGLLISFGMERVDVLSKYDRSSELVLFQLFLQRISQRQPILKKIIIIFVAHDVHRLFLLI